MHFKTRIIAIRRDNDSAATRVSIDTARQESRGCAFKAVRKENGEVCDSLLMAYPFEN